MIAIAVSIAAAFYGIFSGNQLPLLAGIATSLGILAVGLIRDRHNRETLTNQISALSSTVAELSTEKISSVNFFYTRGNLPDQSIRLRRARYTLDLMGTSMFSIGVTHQSSLRELIRNGVNIRLLTSNPDNSNLQEFLALRYLETDTAAIHASQVRASITSLSQIIGKHSTGGSLELRISNHIQTFSYIGTDVEKPEGEIQVELYLTKTGLDRDPLFLLKAVRDAHWFSEFQNQFEYLWDNATIVEAKEHLE